MTLKERKRILECALGKHSYATLKSSIRCLPEQSLANSQLTWLSGLGGGSGGALRSNNLFTKATDFRVV